MARPRIEHPVYAGLPFQLEPRDVVTQIRKRDISELRNPRGKRSQPLAGFAVTNQLASPDLN